MTNDIALELARLHVLKGADFVRRFVESPLYLIQFIQKYEQ